MFDEFVEPLDYPLPASASHLWQLYSPEAPFEPPEALSGSCADDEFWFGMHRRQSGMLGMRSLTVDVGLICEKAKPTSTQPDLQDLTIHGLLDCSLTNGSTLGGLRSLTTLSPAPLAAPVIIAQFAIAALAEFPRIYELAAAG